MVHKTKNKSKVKGNKSMHLKQLCINVFCNVFGSLTEARNWVNYSKRYRSLFVPLVRSEPFMLRNQWVSRNLSFF